MAKADNLLAILWMLRSRKRMTAAEIADELEVDIRTVYRYIDTLSMSGAPIVAEPGPSGGYGLLESFRDAPLFFSSAERVALAHAGLFARDAGYPYSRDLAAALQKVERQLSPDQLEHLHRHAAGLDVIGSMNDSPAGPGAAETARVAASRSPGAELDAGRSSAAIERRLRAIETAVAERSTISISHKRDPAEAPLRRNVDPYGLIYWRENWYLVGYCHLRTDMRMFRCDKIESVTTTGEHFIRREGFSVRGHFIDTLVPPAAARPEVTVRLRGTPYALLAVTRHWFLGKFVRERDEETIGLAVDVRLALDYLPGLVLSCAPDLSVLQPVDVRSRIAAFAREVLDLHNQDKIDHE